MTTNSCIATKNLGRVAYQAKPIYRTSSGARQRCPEAPVTCFSTASRARPAGAPGSGRRGLDKGTLAAAHIGLVRAGQQPARSPDSLRAAAPCQAHCSVRAGVPEASGPGARSGGTLTTRATATAGEMTGDCPRRGAGKSRVLPGGIPRARRAGAWRPSLLPWVGGGPPLRTNRHRHRA